MMKQPELLAPVGEIDSFYAAIENGANAVYVGGKEFSARQHAENLDLKQIKEIVNYAHLRNVKVYVTLNTLIKNSELNDLIEYIHNLSIINIDGLIVQDFGVARIVKSYFPNLPLHASTQMNAHSVDDVIFLEKEGYKRVILARELSIDEISNIKKNTNIEIETFIHGSLCVSYSGQCLMSSMIGGRSGNRGRCAQPCRLPYTLFKNGVKATDDISKYLLSPKDIETLDLIPKLIDIGVDTFKIEGRMKSPEYVSSVVRNYRKYIDVALTEDGYKVEQSDKDELLSVFNRGGFTKGYFTEKPGEKMMATSSPKNIGLKIGNVISYNEDIGLAKINTNKELSPGDGIAIRMDNNESTGTGISRDVSIGDFSVKIEDFVSKGDSVYLSKAHNLNKELQRYKVTDDRKSNININVNAYIGKPLEIELTHNTGVTVKSSGPTVSEARNAPLSTKDLENQISRFGNTPFNVKEIKTNMDDNIYIQIKLINQLRREVSSMLEEKILSQNSYTDKGYQKALNEKIEPILKEETTQISGLVVTFEQLKACAGKIDNIYWDLNDQDLQDITKATTLCHEKESKLYIGLPHIQRSHDDEVYKDLILELEYTNIDGYLIRTYGQYNMLENSPKEIVTDYTFNIMNDQSAMYWKEKGITRTTLSVEMSIDEIKKMNPCSYELIVYGHLPLMTSEQCLIGRYGDCSAISEYTLLDRKDTEYPLITNCKTCRMQILSERPIIMLDNIRLRESLPLNSIRLNFTSEDPVKVKEVIDFYKDGKMTHNINGTDGYFKNGVK